MEVFDLVRLYPVVFHVAAAGSWASIRRHGLLSTIALAELWEAQAAIGDLRADSIVLEHGEYGSAVVRDQKPLHRDSLEKALGGEMTVEQWLHELDSRVFFFARTDARDGLMSSPSYRRDAHDVLTVDTASLFDAHGDRIELTGMNTGFAQPHNHKARGRDTFRKIVDFDHPRRERPLTSTRDLVEVCVPHAVPDIADHVIRVDRMSRGESLEVIFQR